MRVNEQAVKNILKSVGNAKLVAATKYVGIEEINEKYEKYYGAQEFHMIGTLQPNKVKYIIDKVSLIHSIDSYSLIKEVEKQAKKHDLKMPILIQVNVAKEESKHGLQ